MYKKLIMACMAVAAFAAFLPAVASASPELTHPTGVTYCPNGGSKGEPCTVTGTNIGETKFTNSTLSVSCTSATMTGNVTRNTGTDITADITEAHFTGTGTSGDCTGTGSFFSGSVKATPEIVGGLPWCLHSGSKDTFTVTGGKCTEAQRPIKFTLDLTGLLSCTYERTEAIPGTFTTHPTDAQLTISEVEFKAITFGCPSPGKLDMTFTLETEAITAEPMYIS